MLPFAAPAMFATERNYIVCDLPTRPIGVMPIYDVTDLQSLQQELPDTFLFLDASDEVRGCSAKADSGELLIIDCRTQPFPGDMVLASFGREFCVMRLWIENGLLWLEEGTRPEIRTQIEIGRGCTLYGIICGLARLHPFL